MAENIIIIGAGLAGLAAGCYAQMNGYQSHIFEHHDKAGGVAAAWKRQGYLVDGGIHFLMGHRPGQPIYDLYNELGATQARCLDMITYGRFVDEAGEYSVTITADLERLANDLKALAPEDIRIVDELVAGARAMQDAGALFATGLGRPPGLTGPLDQIKQMWAMRRLFKYFTGKYARPVADYVQGVHSPMLRRVLENLFMPEVPVWFILSLLALLADKQIGLLEGGCHDFISSIEKRYQALGGQATYRATVEEIVVDNHRAVGVRLADGREHRADVVVSAADGYSTIFKMLGGRYVDEKIKERYRTWQLIRPTLTVSFGVMRTFPDEPHEAIFLLKSPIVIGDRPVNGFALRIFNYSDVFAPPGKTVIQAMLETEWDYWNSLQQDRPRYEAEKERVAQEVLARLEAHYPGLSSQVEMTDVASPYTTWRYTLNYKGAYMGWLPTPSRLMSSIPRTLPGLGHFYMAGQWVVPGGGVPPCLYSGRHVIQILCHTAGRPFVSFV